jgi:hypothetical protein
MEDDKNFLHSFRKKKSGERIHLGRRLNSWLLAFQPIPADCDEL